MKILKIIPLFTFSERRILFTILMTKKNIWRQMFYRSSGKNSGLPGAWLPCLGIAPDGQWIVKRWRDPSNPEVIQNLNGNRLGPYKDVSTELKKRESEFYEEFHYLPEYNWDYNEEKAIAHTTRVLAKATKCLHLA